jgi:hypothetical protein
VPISITGSSSSLAGRRIAAAGRRCSRPRVTLRQRNPLDLAGHRPEFNLAPVALRLFDALTRTRDEVPPG